MFATSKSIQRSVIQSNFLRFQCFVATTAEINCNMFGSLERKIRRFCCERGAYVLENEDCNIVPESGNDDTLQTSGATDNTEDDYENGAIRSESKLPERQPELDPSSHESNHFHDRRCHKSNGMPTTASSKSLIKQTETYQSFQETHSDSFRTNKSFEPENDDFEHILPTTKTHILVYSKDITSLDVDCIVNAANGALQHAGGVAKAIATKAGDKLKEVWYNHSSAVTLPLI